MKNIFLKVSDLLLSHVEVFLFKIYLWGQCCVVLWCGAVSKAVAYNTYPHVGADSRAGCFTYDPAPCLCARENHRRA